MRSSCISAFAPAFFYLGVSSLVHAQQPPDAEWARIVPGDAHFYAELRGLAQVRELFRRLNIWDLVRDLGERDRPGATTRPWSSRTQKMLGMDTDEAISRLLSRRAALIATEAAHWQNGVVLGELKDQAELTRLLAQWQATRTYEEGPVKCYTLRGGLRLAIQERVFALGPPEDPDGLWGRTVQLLAGRRGPQLAGRAEFAALHSRMSRTYQGLVYSSWDDDDPHSVADCHRVMVGFDVATQGITAEFHGQRRRPASDNAYSGYPIAKLPASTIVAFAGQADFSKLFGKKYEDGTIDPRSLVDLFLGFFSHGEESPVNLLTQLGPNFVLSLSREDSGPVQLPVLTVVCDSARPAEHIRQLDVVIGFFSALLASFEQSAASSAPTTNVNKSTCEGIELHHVPLGKSLARRLGLQILNPIECCWCQLEGRLVLSSSRRFTEELIKVAQGKSAAINPAQIVHSSDKPAETLVIRGIESAAMIESWLNYVRAHHPHAAVPTWWQSWARTQFEKSTELGLTVQADAQGRAIVREVQIFSPAKDLLKYDDIIVAVSGKSLDRNHPALDLAKRYQARGSSREFALDILRGDEKLTVKIPITPADALDMTDFNPMLDLQRLQTLLARVRLLTLTRQSTRPDRLDASLSVEWAPSK